MFRDLVPFAPRSRAVGRRAHPFDDFRHEMDRLFEDFWGGDAPAVFNRDNGIFAAKVDVAEDDKAFRVTADLPGFEEKDVEVTLSDGVLSIRGEKKAEREEKDEKTHYHLTERSYGSFERRFNVGDAVEQKKVEAEFKNGVLSVTLPKAKQKAEKAKRIAIKAR